MNRETQSSHSSAPILQPPDFSPSTVGFMGSEFGRSHAMSFQEHHQHPQHPQPLPHLQPHPLPFASPQSHEIQEAIQREIEKSKIRDQMIIDEIVRRRILESEVRRELMQSELALRQGINTGFLYNLPPVMGLDSPVRLPAIGSMAEGRLLDGRHVLSHPERERLNGNSENGWKDIQPFQRGTTNLRVSEVKPVSEGSKGIERIILQPKPDEVSRLKRKAAAPSSAAEAGENLSENMLRKRAKEEWSCALCQVSATSERALNDHLEGKKHKAKEAKLKAKAAKKILGMSVKVERSGSPCMSDGPKSTSESLLSQKAGEASSETNDQGLLQKSICSGCSTVPNSDNPKKGKFKFWCEICQVGAYSLKVMNGHKKGKKHLFRLQNSNQNTGANTSDDNKNTASDTVDVQLQTESNQKTVKATDESETKHCVVDDDVAAKPDVTSTDELTVS